MVFNEGNFRRVNAVRLPRMRVPNTKPTQYANMAGGSRARVALQGVGYTMPFNKVNGTLSDHFKKDRTVKTMGDNLSKFKTKYAESISAANAARKTVNKKAGGSLLGWLGKHKVPQIAAGVGIAAFLVNKLSDNRGRQTNAQLYGQAPLY